MTTNDWTDRLSEYLDGTLTPEETVACEAWLASSEDGRALLADLRRVVAKAKTLPDVPVPEGVWSGISAAIKRPEATVTPISSPSRRLAASPSRRWQLSPFQLAAAAAILLALGTGIGLMFRAGAQPQVEVAGNAPADRSPFTSVSQGPGGESYDKAVQELRSTLEQNRSSLDPATVQVLEQSLARIDAALAEAEGALAADPNNDYLNDHLSRIRRKKLDLLRQGAALVQAS